jgi:FAD synthase
VGVFDGLHIGHKALIGKVVGRSGFASAVVTFKENPKRILSPSTFSGDISTLSQRLDLIESMGADFVVLIDFSGDFSKLPGRRFLSMLEERAALRYLAVGHDFRCGYELDTDSESIRAFCEERSIGIELLRAVNWAGHAVSSSRIRKAITEGRLEDAASMLGRPYELDIRVSHIGASDCFARTASQAIPPPGIYGAVLVWAGAFAPNEVLARLDGEGFWFLYNGDPLTDGQRVPVGLRLLRLVSRE